MNEAVGIRQGWVDDKGRLKLPTDFRKMIELHPDWFIARDDESLRLQTAPKSGHRVEVDSTGKMLITSDLSSEFKNKEVRIVVGPGQVEVISGEEFEILLNASINVGPLR